MSTTTMPRGTTTRTDSGRARSATGSLPPPSRLTAAQLRELDAELRRELAALDRRLASEMEDASTPTPDPYDGAITSATTRASDILVRRDEVAQALARLAAGTYGACAGCASPIPYGRLLVMPEATYCLICRARQ